MAIWVVLDTRSKLARHSFDTCRQSSQCSHWQVWSNGLVWFIYLSQSFSDKISYYLVVFWPVRRLCCFLSADSGAFWAWQLRLRCPVFYAPIRVLFMRWLLALLCLPSDRENNDWGRQSIITGRTSSCGKNEGPSQVQLRAPLAVARRMQWMASYQVPN